jgi:predicted acyltransferase
MQFRNNSIDALRGYSILTMILSGSIAYSSVMPAWMFHAQVPPPLHKFIPTIPGITWVDLVFPFFLFSMGASIPLALKKHFDAKSGFIAILKIAIKRFALLIFFALFTNHMKAWVIAENPGIQENLLSIFAFALLFFQFYKSDNHKTIFFILKVIAFVLAIILLFVLPFWKGTGFDFYKSDIIIVVLANMAFFATIIYYFTVTKPNIRWGILVFIMAFFLAAKEPTNSWTKSIFNFSHIGNLYFDWCYQFYFLKYLFIVIPGTIAGDFILQDLNNKALEVNANNKLFDNYKRYEFLLAVLSVTLVLLNLYGLFTRALLFNFISTTIICIVSLIICNKTNHISLLKKFTETGTYLLLLGLCFEAYEGGIKKDVSTYSYYFVCSGLAFFCLIIFTVLNNLKYSKAIVKYLSLNGQNPMVAYVAGSLIVLPVLSITQLNKYWDGMNQNLFIGTLKGLLFTAVVSIITIFCVKKKWFWKT